MLHQHGSEVSSVGGSGLKTNSLIKGIGICIPLVVLAIAVIKLFNLSLNTVFFIGILLVCPLLHLWMMRSGGHKHQ